MKEDESSAPTYIVVSLFMLYIFFIKGTFRTLLFPKGEDKNVFFYMNTFCFEIHIDRLNVFSIVIMLKY